MPPQLTVTDRDILAAHLDLFDRAGLRLSPGIEPADVEDGVCDELECFRLAPATTVLSLIDADAHPFFTNLTFPDNTGLYPTTHAQLPAYIRAVCAPAGTDLRDVTVVPDPGSLDTGTARLQFGEWDVVDVSYDLSAGGWEPDRVNGSHGLIPDLIAAAIPNGGEAGIFSTADGETAVVYLRDADLEADVPGAVAVHGRPAPHTAPDAKKPMTAAAARAAARNAAIDNLFTVLFAEAES